MTSSLRFPAAIVLAATCLFPFRLDAQTQTNPVAQYFATEVNREDMVSIPMRDGARLNASLFFPKKPAGQKLPSILIFFPYLISPASWPENKRFMEAGYEP